MYTILIFYIFHYYDKFVVIFKLHILGLLLRHYTQNIDTLERGAQIPEEKIVEAHGTFYTSHCLDCRKQYPLEFVKGMFIIVSVTLKHSKMHGWHSIYANSSPLPPH